ncbi:uncharacterized protein L969DRAFT_42474, partial [Mixia osmundae IAM 14324]|uniref:uncharacterized protein n=1 Tax=Mixia osmundae (strain CBS 9802 / IAM 14324 / JCM 22182 / KY 12970) TaxID=764103 RepID=UPI0004A54A2E
YLILHPDVLVTCTRVAETLFCPRKAILQERLRATSEITEALVYGNLLHEVMQRCLVAGRFDLAARTQAIEGLLANTRCLERLWALSLDRAAVQSELLSRSAGLPTWAERYCNSEEPKAEAKLVDPRSVDKTAETLSLRKILDIEEDIWSPRLGLKGKIDASVEVQVHDETSRSDVVAISPLEIKTGRMLSNMIHRAQTMLYTLLMSERYDAPIALGLLVYSQQEHAYKVDALRNELRGLLISRNTMVNYLATAPARREPISPALTPSQTSDSTGQLLDDIEDNLLATDRPELVLPDGLDNAAACSRCFVRPGCMLYRKVSKASHVHYGDELQKIFASDTDHLEEHHVAFFRKWERLLSMEDKDQICYKREIWTMSAPEREQQGRCLADMRVRSLVRVEALEQSDKIHRYTCVMSRGESILPTGLLTCRLSPGDPVVVSVQDGATAVARGFILDVTPTELKLGLDHDPGSSLRGSKAVKYRVDLEELLAGTGRLRDNLAQLLYAHGDVRLRAKVIDLMPPRFCSRHSQDSITTGTGLNMDQHHALVMALTADDYALVHGMPGTGKTTLIAEMVKTFVARGQTVLLAAHTHSAVDTLVSKICSSVHVLRLGNIDKVREDLRHLTLADSDMQSLADVERMLMAPPVVATTCLGINHIVFSRRRFDVCILDEASQVLLPVALGPLRYADRFVLVGDHHQLPPVVRSRQARKEGYDESLFSLLSTARPESVAHLTIQYRMTEPIMRLASHAFYNDKLVCGSADTATQQLQLPLTLPFANDWCSVLFNPACRSIADFFRSCCVGFVDTDDLPARDSWQSGSWNDFECTVVVKLINDLLARGITQQQIGVITPYREQVRLLKSMLDSLRGIEVLTADKSQGRDKDCVIISLVRSNEEGSTGELLKDWRRLNVSITRARRKMILIGSRSTVSRIPFIDKLIRRIEQLGQVVRPSRL